MDKRQAIGTVYSSDAEILGAVKALYCDGGYDLDPTYGKGVFYKTGNRPRICVDIDPESSADTVGDFENLNYRDRSLRSIVFDPPFLAGGGESGRMKARFSSYRSYPDLIESYSAAAKEFYRILDGQGFLIFKTQDFVCARRQFFLHIDVFNICTEIGFRGEDLFVKLSSSTMVPGRQKVQDHARKKHSFFYVFRKPGRRGS